ncbi:MAG: hypothetical protein ACK2UW_20745 [Anaerolineales bacterium]
MLEFKRLDEFPQHVDQINRLSAASWPEFLRYGDADHWDALFSTFAAQQILLLDNDEHPVDEGEHLIAAGHCVPLVWDGTLEDLPESINAIILRAIAARSHDQAPNTISALAALIDPQYRGQGLSSLLIEAMKSVGQQLGCTNLIAPVRPTWKSRYPLQSMEQYASWLRDDRAPYDPWIRVHWRLGAEQLCVAPSTLKVYQPIPRWQDWTSMIFPEDGNYIVPGALQPVRIDQAAGMGYYDDPNVWMRHPIP